MGYDLAAALTEDREAWGLEFAWTREQPQHRKQTKSDVFTGGSDVGPKGRQSCFCISLPKLGKLVGFRAGCREHFDWMTFRMSSPNGGLLEVLAGAPGASASQIS